LHFSFLSFKYLFERQFLVFFFCLLTSYVSWSTKAPFLTLLSCGDLSLGLQFHFIKIIIYLILEKRSRFFQIHFMDIVYRLIWIVFLFFRSEGILIVDSPSVEEGWFSKMPSLQLLHLTKHRDNILASRRYLWCHCVSVLWISFAPKLISLFWFFDRFCSLMLSCMVFVCSLATEERRFICLEFVS